MTIRCDASLWALRYQLRSMRRKKNSIIFFLCYYYILHLKQQKKNICNHIMTCLIFVCFSVRSVNSHQKRGILTQYVWSNIIKNYLMSEAIQSTNIKRVGQVVFKILFFYSDLLIQSLHSCLSPLRIVVHWSTLTDIDLLHESGTVGIIVQVGFLWIISMD